MDSINNLFRSIDEYISIFTPDVQEKLKEIRSAIQTVAPQAEERINYQMPTYFLNGNLVHFAAQKHHIGFYPTPSAIQKFRGELSPYKYSKGAVQFPLDQPLPLDLIGRMVAFRVQENLQKAAVK